MKNTVWVGLLFVVTACSGLESDLERLEGTWYSVGTEWDGATQSGENRSDLHVIVGDEVIAQLDGVEVSRSRIELDENAKVITFHMLTGPSAGREWVGIYEITDDTARWCGAWIEDLGEEMPATFTTEPGDLLFLRAMRRMD